MSCEDGHCITCSDAAEPMRVLSLDTARELALCEDRAGARHTVESGLVDAGVGDEVLVHAAVALAVLEAA
jgi:hydrogenase maturation factor